MEPMKPRYGDFQNATRGFTLVEMVIVLVLLGIIFTFVAPMMGGLAPKYRLRTYSRKIAETIEKARIAAIVRGRVTGIRYVLSDFSGTPISCQLVPPASFDYPDEPLDERVAAITNEPPTGVIIQSVILPSGENITSGVINIAFTPSGITGSHIVVLEIPDVDGNPMIISLKYNSISGILDFANHEVMFQHYEG